MKLASLDLEPQFPVHVISTSFAALKIPSLADVAEVSQQLGRLTERSIFRCSTLTRRTHT